MFDIAWSELGVVAVVALVVIGPKDLPKVLRTMGQWTSKARSMAREFQSGLDDMVREAELDDLRKAAKQVTDFSIENEIKKAVDPDGSMAEDFKKTEAEMNAMLTDAEQPGGFQPPAVEAPAAEIPGAETPAAEPVATPVAEPAVQPAAAPVPDNQDGKTP
ncbi:Sec-independent protein translocase protein TatB [Ferrovibrio xuzhouensis]|uniref:Sec-independent protein translocase protein TatB n=1 Tax=Ferrovibrio xuzhouensis TaxID=1576914 RepID=A0ABV7VIX4_9PROT